MQVLIFCASPSLIGIKHNRRTHSKPNLDGRASEDKRSKQTHRGKKCSFFTTHMRPNKPS